MSPDNNLKAVFSVTEVINELGLSRGRFYQLQKMGVFPKPLRSSPKRPFYPPDLRQKCIDIRKTGIGYNGQPTVFYNLRKDKSLSQLSYERLTDALLQMNKNVTPDAVKKAVNALYPNGLPPEYDEGGVIRDLYRYFDNGGCKNAI
jgi:hypothetical protein